MHTHNQSILATPSGWPFNPARVSVAHASPKNPRVLRIVVDGEAVSDTWSTAEEANRFAHKIHLGMMGVTTGDNLNTVPIEPPPWATVENAIVVAREHERCGGTRAHAASAFSNTVLGIGQPASVIDSDLISSAFDDAIKVGKVLVLAGMPDPTHCDTKDSILDHSPLARAALAALDDISEKSDAAAGLADLIEFDPTRAGECTCVVTVGEDGLRELIAEIDLPRRSYSWCSLNSTFFLDWVGWQGNPAVKLDNSIDPVVRRAEYDPNDPAHADVMLALAAYFEASGWTCAADRVRDDMETRAQ